jgi:serine/threonine protein kinase
MLRSRGGSSNALLLPAGAFVRSNSSGLLGSPSGWETPLGMGPGGAEGPGMGPGGYISPEQQMQMALGGPLGQLQRGVSDVVSEVEVIAEDPPLAQHWTATSAELWPIMYRELTFLKQIGEGSFGRVYMARWRETTVAVKVLHRQSGDHLDDDDLPLDPCPSAGSPDPILHALQKEAGIMASVRHPNVISYLGVCAEPACIVTEYCSKGSLTDVLRRGRASPAHAAALDWPRRLNMAMDAAKGMLHLHLCDPPIIHRDLKSPNLLVDKHWKLKVCDFNLSRVMEESVVLSSMVASNPRWLAPEILAGLPYTVAADVYSFGVIMWELLTWEVPWHQQNTWQVHAMVTVEHLRPDIPADVAVSPGGTFGGIAAYLELMKACWAQSPDDRPDFESVIGRLRRMLAVETLARQPSVAGSSGGSPSRHTERPMFTVATASAPNSASSPLTTR